MKHIPIFFAVDNNYAPNLSVVIESIKENSSLDYIYDIYVLNENISTDYSNLNFDASAIQQKLADPENMELLRSVLSKLG